MSDETPDNTAAEPELAQSGASPIPRPEKRKPGRPPKVTAEVRAEILKATEAGHHKSVVAAWVGIHPRTLDMLIADSEEAYRNKLDGKRLSLREKTLCEFLLDYRKSEARPEVAAVGVLADAMKGKNVKAAGFFLERRYPSRWRRRNMLENAPTGGDNPPPDAPAGALALTFTSGTDNAAREDARDDLLQELARRGYNVESLVR